MEDQTRRLREEDKKLVNKLANHFRQMSAPGHFNFQDGENGGQKAQRFAPRPQVQAIQLRQDAAGFCLSYAMVS